MRKNKKKHLLRLWNLRKLKKNLWQHLFHLYLRKIKKNLWQHLFHLWQHLFHLLKT